MKLFKPRGTPPGERRDQHLPKAVVIDGYGDGGFRFADMSHRGSLLCLPSGVHGWSVTEGEGIDVAALAPIVAEAGTFDFLVVGTGRSLVPLSAVAVAALREAGIRHEAMATGSALRMYNIMLGEDRRVAAAFVAVD